MSSKKDNIGVLRLVFASLVIFSHAPEQVDGDRHREPLTMIFHTVSLGDLSVDAFFLISGYLIAMSWLRTNNIKQYFERRVLRIYPAFICAYIITVLCLGPLVGAAPWRFIAEGIFRMATLLPPKKYPGQLSGLHSAYLNRSMWTIQYEFRCYIFIAALGISGLLKRRFLICGLTCLGLIVMAGKAFQSVKYSLDAPGPHELLFLLIGDPGSDIRLFTTFLVGTCFYLFRDLIISHLSGRVAVFSGLAACVVLYDPHFAELGLVTLGAVFLFWVCFKANLRWFQKINDRWDISYGVYLYGWPVATAIRWLDRGVSPWALAAVTLPIAMLFGAASWWGLERWMKYFRRSKSISESFSQNSTALV